MYHIGIDSTEIDRFVPWTTYSHRRLKRIYSKEELDYSFEYPAKIAERLAVRFAAKEAFYKAIVPLLKYPVPFLSVCRTCSTTNSSHGTPKIIIDWEALRLPHDSIAQASFTHTRTTATAVVLISSVNT